MTDTPAAGGERPQGLTRPPLVVRSQYTKDLSFENPNAPGSLEPQSTPPEVHISVGVDTRELGGSIHEVVLSLRGEASRNEDVVFIVELSYGGTFEVSDEVPADNVKPLLLIECPRLLFPFAREILSSATRDGGLPPLLLQPIDFVALYRQRLAEEESQTGTVGHA